MTAAATTGLSHSGLSPVNRALEPASVRRGGAAAQRAYEEALGFEQVLVNQLAQELVDSVASQSASGGTDAASGMYSQLLPGALSTGIMSAGGLGLAAQLVPSLDSEVRP